MLATHYCGSSLQLLFDLDQSFGTAGVRVWIRCVDLLPLNFGHWTFGEVGRLSVVENRRLSQGRSWLHIANLIAALAVVRLVVRPGRLSRLDHLAPLVVAHPGFPAFNSSLLYLLLNHAFPVALS